MSTFSFSGTYTALVTPFRDDESVDEDAFAELVRAQLAGGVAGLVPCGTTGESPTLDDEEHVAVIRRTVELVGGRVPVLAGTGSNATHEAIDLSRRAVAAGADAVMLVTPYYNRPSQEGIFGYVRQVAASVPCPVVLYDIPGRTGVQLEVETTLRILDACPNVVGVKDATGNVLRCQELLLRAGDRVAVLSGDDGLTVPMMAVGARGVISVTSNVLPAEVSAVVSAALAGRFDEALARHRALLDVHAAMFVEPNPSPVKAALELLGRCGSRVRSPLAPASDKARERVAAALRAHGALGAVEGRS